MMRTIRSAVLAPALLALCAGCLAEPVTWDFEGEQTGWRPRSEGVALSRVEVTDAPGEGQFALRIAGTQTDGWNYAISDTHAMTAGGLYRLSAQLKVESLGETSPYPYLKCEFVHEDRTQNIGRVNTNSYDPQHMGQWQELTCEFMAPENTVGFWLAVEKGGSQPCEIVALLDDVKVETIDKLTRFEKYRLDPVPDPLEKMRGVHPRMYVTDERVAELREAIKTTHAKLWDGLRSRADSLAARGAPKYRERDGHSGDEQLWQREVGNAMPNLAMAWLLTSDRKYLDAAREWALASCSYPTWGLGRIDGMDLSAGHQLLGLALVYDWCYADLSQEDRATIRETLTRRATHMFDAAATGQAWWQRSYLQNHLWVDVCGMSAAGFALFDEVEDASMWIGLPLEKFRTTMASLGPDGASHEGVGYWEYGAEYMLKFMDLARSLLDEDMFDNEWWRNTASYAQYFALPRNAWTRRNCIVDIADCPRNHWYGPDHILRRLAAEYGDEHAQWLADQVTEADVDASSSRWLNIIWYDPQVDARPPTDLPTLKHFTDMGLVAARSDWSGDESLVVFKCGPFIGHEAIQKFAYDPGGGHVHPDANHFLVFANGEWLIRDDGYRAKFTGTHNTLLIDGKGQLGEGRQWFNGSEPLRVKASPKVTLAASTPGLDHIVGDATEAYPPESGLQRYVRHLLFLKPDVLIVVDDIVADADRNLELRFHPEADQAEREGNAFLIRSEKTALRLEALTPDGVECKAGMVEAAGRGEGVAAPMYTVSLSTHANAWRNATALSWSAAGEEPAAVSVHTEGNKWTFEAGGREVVLDWATGEARGE